MAINLLEVLREVVGDKSVKEASSFLGESEVKTGSALKTILPAVLGGVVEKGSSKQGASAIFDFINNETLDGKLLDNLEGMFGGGKGTDGLMEKGSTMLDFIFEAKDDLPASLIDIVTNSSGIGRGSCNSLTQMVTPIILGSIGRQMKSGSLDEDGLTELLKQQREPLQAATPPGFFEKIGLNHVELKTTGSGDEESDDASGHTSTLRSRLGPWLLLGSLALGLLFVMRSCGGRELPNGATQTGSEASMGANQELTSEDNQVLQGDPVNVAANSQDVVEKSTRKVMDGIAMIKLPDGHEINTKTGSFIDQVYAYLSDKEPASNSRFSLDNLVFQTGTAKIEASSEPQLHSAAALLKAYPVVPIKIVSYQGSEGNPDDKELSQQRALAVKTALVQMGLSDQRISLGDGSQKVSSAADNAESENGMIPRIEIVFNPR